MALISIPSERPAKEQKEAAAYLELHIEQGPVLERLALPLGSRPGNQGRGTLRRDFPRRGSTFRIDADGRATGCPCAGGQAGT